jgi:hypothetical protein
MDQAVSHWPLTAKAWVQAWNIPYGICGEQSGTATGSSQASLESFYKLGTPKGWIPLPLVYLFICSLFYDPFFVTKNIASNDMSDK